LGYESTHLITFLVIMPDLVRRNLHEMLDLADGRAEVILEFHLPNDSVGSLKRCPTTPIERASPVNDEHILFNMSIGV
jgi:hypothetical protein